MSSVSVPHACTCAFKADHLGLDKLSVDTSLEKTDSLSFSSHWLPIVLHQEWSLVKLPPYTLVCELVLSFCRSCLCSYIIKIPWDTACLPCPLHRTLCSSKYPDPLPLQIFLLRLSQFPLSLSCRNFIVRCTNWGCVAHDHFCAFWPVVDLSNNLHLLPKEASLMRCENYIYR